MLHHLILMMIDITLNQKLMIKLSKIKNIILI